MRRWGLVLLLVLACARSPEPGDDVPETVGAPLGTVEAELLEPVANGGFEQGEGGAIAGWDLSGGMRSETNPAHVHGGARSLAIADASATAASVARSRTVVPARAGRTYAATFWCKVRSGRVDVAIEFLNRRTPPRVMASPTCPVTAAPPGSPSSWCSYSVSGGWQRVTVQLDGPWAVGAARLAISTQVADASVGGHCDDVSLREVRPVVTSGVYVANGGFERSPTILHDWTRPNGMAGVTISAHRAASGAHAVRMDSTAATTALSVRSRLIPVLEGKRYQASARYFHERAGDVAYAYLEFFGRADATTPIFSPRSPEGRAAGSWQPLTVSAVAPEDAHFVAVRLYASLNNAGVTYFDEATAHAFSSSLANASFENGDTDGFPYNWTPLHLAADAVAAAAKVEGVKHAHDSDAGVAVAAGVFGGVRIADDDPSAPVGIRSAFTQGIVAGRGYQARADCQVARGTLHLYLEFWGPALARIESTSPPSPVTASLPATGGWARASVEGIAPPGATLATVLLYSTIGDAANEAVCDRVTLEPLTIEVGDRRQLFIDDHVLRPGPGSRSGVERVFHPAIKHPGNPLIGPDPARPWEANPYLYGTVIREAPGSFKMWYTSRGFGLLGFATSSDGVTWNRSDNRNHFTVDGSATYDVAIPSVHRTAAGGYQMMSFGTGRYRTYSSSNGKDFRSQGEGLRGWDVTTSAWDRFGGLYVSATKRQEGDRRIQRMATSADLSSWTVPVRMYGLSHEADALDDGGQWSTGGHYVYADSYGVALYPHHGAFVGVSWLLKVTDAVAYDDGPVEPVLVFSRDLTEDWQRLAAARPAIALGSRAAGHWDAGSIYTASYAIDVPADPARGRALDEVWLYYSGWTGTHGSPGRAQIGLATWRRDGFASLEVPADGEGWFETRLLVVPGFGPGVPTRLRVNADPSAPGASIKVAVLDESGEELPGLGHVSSVPLAGPQANQVSQLVSWNAHGDDLSALVGRAIRLRFHLGNGARLYAFELARQ
jgi:hypothetical protein